MYITPNERTAMNATLNYNNRQAQLSDNYSNAGMSELCEELNMRKAQVVGVISSLAKKGLADYDSEYDQLWLSEEGVNVIFDALVEV